MKRLHAILALAAPTALGSILQAGAQLVEMWLASRQGTAALAGWAVVLPFALLMQMMAGGAMGGGVVSAIARALGGGRREEAGALVLHAMLIAVVAGLLFAIPLAVFPHAVLGLIGGPAAAEAAAPYAMWLFGLGAIPSWLANTLASVLRGGGRHGLAARVLVLAWGVYPLLGWVLAEPLEMGLAGLGAAFGGVFLLAALGMAAVVLGGGAGFKPRFALRPSSAMFHRILAVGLVASVIAMIANMTTILVTAQLAPLGPAVVAGYGISARLEFLMIPLVFAVGSSLTALVGRAVGQGDWAEARRIAWTGGLMSLSVAGLIGAVVALMPETFARQFSDDAAVVAVAAQALAIIGWAYGGFGLGMTMYFASQGTGRMGWPLAGALSRFGVAVGGGWVLAQALGLGLTGQFIGVALGITAYGAVIASSVRPQLWR